MSSWNIPNCYSQCNNTHTNWSPVTRETPTHYMMDFIVAGAPKENLTVENEENTIYIKGKCDNNNSYNYCYDMPKNIDVSFLNASYNNGLITVSVKKTLKLPRKIITLG